MVNWLSVTALLVGAALSVEAVAQDTTPGNGAIRSTLAGIEVELMVLTEVNTRISAPGSVVRLRLNKPVIVDGMIALPVGVPAFGKVESVVKSGIAGARGEIGVKLTHIEASGGPIPLADELLLYRARGGKNDDAAKLLLVPFYAPFSPANSAKLKAGELIRGRILDTRWLSTAPADVSQHQ